jgi:large subunit ribosomal protein L18
MSIRKKVRGTSETPRLAVFRSTRHISAQIVDDVSGVSLGGVSSEGKEFKASHPKAGGKTDVAKAVGAAIAEMAKSKGITKVRFDRGGYLYHGRVRALAEGAREAGLEF